MRHVDWRASARYKGNRDLLVRRYQAEEQFTIVLSLDSRPSLWLPKGLPKLQVCFWLAESISRIALASGDRIFLHSLFSNETSKPIRLERSSGLQRLSYSLREIADQASSEAAMLNLRVLESILKPATVWIIVTDLYFGDLQADDRLGETANTVARAMMRARSGLRWVMLVDLDTWDHETTSIEGNYYVDEPAARKEVEPYELNEPSLASVSRRISEYKSTFLERSRLPVDSDYSHWKWPAKPVGHPTGVFEQWFNDDQSLGRLFGRSS
jgi:hypothetical protein